MAPEFAARDVEDIIVERQSRDLRAAPRGWSQPCAVDDEIMRWP
jgi:hypothetical protein